MRVCAGLSRAAPDHFAGNGGKLLFDFVLDQRRADPVRQVEGGFELDPVNDLAAAWLGRDAGQGLEAEQGAAHLAGADAPARTELDFPFGLEALRDRAKAGDAALRDPQARAFAAGLH